MTTRVKKKCLTQDAELGWFGLSGADHVVGLADVLAGVGGGGVADHEAAGVGEGEPAGKKG